MQIIKETIERMSANKNLTTALSPSNSKLLLTASIDSDLDSEEFTTRLLSVFLDQNLLTSELLYVGFNAAYRRNKWKLCHHMILTAEKYSIPTDIEMLNSTVNTLVRNDRVEEAWKILENINEGKYGSDIACELAMYETVLSYACLHGYRDLVLKILEIVGKASTNSSFAALAFPSDFDRLCMSALQSCAFRRDFQTAMEVYILYLRTTDDEPRRLHFDPKTYSYLLISYLRSEDVKAPATSRLLESIVAHVIRLKVDLNPAVANLLLQFYSVRNDVIAAKDYLSKMKSADILVTTNAWLKYREMLDRGNPQNN